ncbi:hypothetical protein [Vampirovibrio chlorellavorus]|uniref:hypothetical protein n=1 Tax=Vampirovibrio chlorellavorus TaxID=758823 RepID=UPI0026EE329B|nr:hypothetical protein [Vampirovibrio chlorellavorus]
MEITSVLNSKLNIAHRVLSELIQDYSRLDDTQRMEKSNTIMDEIYSYVQIKENLLFPFIQEKGLYNDLIARSAAVDQDINRIIELSIMMHVDEPSGEYYHNMITLRDLLEKVERVDGESVFAWIREYLTEEDQYYITSHLKNQMTHESVSSSGMTIY